MQSNITTAIFINYHVRKWLETTLDRLALQFLVNVNKASIVIVQCYTNACATRYSR